MKKRTCDDIEIEKYNFYQYKNLISLNKIDIKKIEVYKKFPFGKQDFRHFTGYKKIKPLCMFFPEKNAYRFRKLNVFFLMKDKNFLEKYNEIWEKVRNIIKKKFKI